MTSKPTIASALREGALVWYPVLGTTAMWMAHLVSLASLTRFTCTTNKTWSLHAITVVTAAGALAGVLLAAHAVRTYRVDDSADTDAGRRRFMGLLGVIVALANLLLSLGEEGMVFGFLHHRCG